MSGETVFCLCQLYVWWYANVCTCGHQLDAHLDEAGSCVGDSLVFRPTPIPRQRRTDET